MSSYIHHTSSVTSTMIGHGSKIWQYCVVLEGAIIGEDCNICAHVFIESDVVLGDRVTIKSGVQLWDGLRLHNDVFIGPNVTFTNDVFPRSKIYTEKTPITIVEDGASVGAAAVVLPGITIGAFAMVGAGAVVVKDVAPFSLVVGNPARHVRFLNDDQLHGD